MKVDAETKLRDYLARDYRIYWLDEMMVTKTTYKKAEYMVKHKNVTIDQMTFNNTATAFVGCVALDLGLFHYNVFNDSVDSDKFVKFLSDLLVKNGNRKFVLYMDSLRVHKSKVTMKFMRDHNIEYIFAPYYSPDFNAIEYCFSPMKQLIRR